MIIFSRFQEKIIEYNLGKNLGGKCVVLYLLVPHQSQVIVIMEQTRRGESSLTVWLLKIIKIHVKKISHPHKINKELERIL